MDELETIEKLTKRARSDGPPPVNVASAVLARLRTARPTPILPLAIVAAGAAIAAALIVAFAAHAWMTGVDPQAALFPTLEIAQL